MTTYSYVSTMPGLADRIEGVVFPQGVSVSYPDDNLVLNKYVPTRLNRFVDGVLSNTDLVTPESISAQERYNAIQFLPGAQLVAASRDLSAADNGLLLECTATVSLTVPLGLPVDFTCNIMTSGTTSVVSSGGALLNGGTGTLIRTAVLTPIFSIIARKSAANSYLVTGD